MSTAAQAFAGLKTFNDGIRLPAGTLSAVAAGKSGDDNTGINFPAADTINVVTAGALRAQFDSAGVMWVVSQLKLDSAGRVINVPQIVLPGGSGGYGYGGGLELGGAFNVLQHDGANMYMQAYGSGVTAEVKSFFSTAMLTGFVGANPGASDVVTKIGTRTAAASVNDSAKLLSIRATIGGAEVEYAYFKKPAGAFTAQFVLDSKSATHVGAIAILNQGAGDTGIFFESGAAAGGVSFGLGSVGTRGLLTSSTNRTQAWLINSGAYSGAARALYDWEASEDAYQKTIPFLRYQADSAHNADIARWYKGATLLAALSKFGVFTTEAVIANSGAAINAGGLDVNGGIRIGDATTLGFGTFAEDLTAPPVGVQHEVTLNAAKGRLIHSGSFGSTKVNCDKCTASSVVVPVLEDPTGNIVPAAIPDDGFFTLQNDGGGYWDVTLRFVVFN